MTDDRQRAATGGSVVPEFCIRQKRRLHDGAEQSATNNIKEQFMLELIYGEAGTGKSSLLYKGIAEAAESGKKVFLFVPDQFSFEAEKRVYRTVKPPHGMNVTVTMLSRAAQKILQLYGETKSYADDIVKNMLMTRVLKGLSAEGRLVYYRRQLKNKGFPQIMLGIIGELRNGGVTPSMLRTIIADNGDGFSEILMNKLNDISEVYTEYDGLLTVSFDDRLDDVRRAAELCPESGYFRDSVCFFDGFDEFSGSQLEFIRAVCASAEKTVFTVTTDAISTDNTVFMASAQLAQRLKAMDDEVILTPLTRRFRGNPVCETVRAQDMWQECDWICSKIHELAEEGCRYRDIAVLMPDKAYGQIMASAMKKYDIPAFVDIPQPLIDKSVVRFTVYALQALSFETDDLLRYVKSGFVRQSNGKTISAVQADKLEQLCRCYGIERRDWLRPFPERADPDGEMEKLRLEIISPLQKFRSRTENADGMELTEALCDFICREMDIGKSIYSLYLEGRDENGKVIVDKKKQDEYSSLWEDVVEILESAHEALRGSRLSLTEYTDLLIQVFASAEIAKPPQVLDAVTVGDVERSRFTRVKAVFVCGMNQGVFPRSAKTSGNFTGSETEQLISCGITIGGDRVTRASSELFKLYRCVNLPEERLFISFPMLSDSFSQLSPSPYIEDIERYFGISTRGADEYGADFYCRTEKAARRYFSKIYSDYSKKSEKAALKKLLGADPFDGVAENAGERHILSAENAAKLLDKATYSPTALSKINNCKYSFFCRYGLDLKEPNKRELGALLTGNAVHYCLERLLKEQRDSLHSLSDGEITRHVKSSLSDYLKNELAEGFGAGERFSYQVKRLEELAVPAAMNIRDSMAAEQFTPMQLEKDVEYKFGDVTVKGICDRLDVSRDGEYIRVVDYKHGKNELPLKSVYDGENLQMLLYLFGLCRETGKKPSAVLYQPIGGYADKKAASADIEADIAATAEENAALHLANGLILENSPDKKEADFINELYNKLYRAGASRKAKYAKSPVISAENFENLKNYCEAYVNSMVLQTKSGMISACPKDENRCGYCDYSLFCGHEREGEDE